MLKKLAYHNSANSVSADCIEHVLDKLENRATNDGRIFKGEYKYNASAVILACTEAGTYAVGRLVKKYGDNESGVADKCIIDDDMMQAMAS